MGAEPSRPNPPRNNYDYPDYNRAYRPTPAPRQPQNHAQSATDYRGYNIPRTTPNSANPATNTASTSGGRTPFAPRTWAQDPSTSGVTRLTNQTVNSATGGVPKPPTINSPTTVDSRIDTWVTSTIPARTLEVQKVVNLSVSAASTGVSRPSSGVLKPNAVVSTTGSVAKPTSSSVYNSVTCEVSKPVTAAPSIGVSRSNAGTIPTIIRPRTSEVPRVTSQRVAVPSSNGVPTSTASAGVFKATTAAPISGTGVVRKPTSSTLSSGQVKSNQSIYPQLPEVANTCEDNLNKLRSLLREQARIKEERKQTAASEKIVGTRASNEVVNHESKRQTSSHSIDYSSSGMKSQTSPEGIEPSCPEYSLLDPLGVLSHVPNGSLKSSGSNVDHGSRANVEHSDYAGKESDIGLLDLKRDFSPVGSASSHVSRQSSIGGNRGRPKRSKSRKPKKKVVDNSDDPPQYGDVVAEITADHKETQNKITTRKNPPQRQVKVPDRKDNQRPGRPNNMDDRFRPKNVDELNDLIKKEFGSLGEPTHNLPFVIEREKLFSGRNRLFVGNLPFNVTREDVNELMAPYGEIVVDHHNSEKKFGFVTLKHRDQAENAQRNLDGYLFKGRSLRVRLANRHICFKVLNLDAWVTNELLKKAFSAFGDVDRAEIVVEDGKPTGEAFLEFSDRRAGKMALQACVENCFLLTSSLRPVILREIDPDHCSRGFSERQINKNNATYKKAREVGPRFVPEGSKESDCANLWKSFYERRRREEEGLAKKMQQEENLLEERIRSMTS